MAVCQRIWMIPWEMWRDWNNIEHAQDLQKEHTKVDRTIDDKIEQGDNNIEDIVRMIVVSY